KLLVAGRQLSDSCALGTTLLFATQRIALRGSSQARCTLLTTALLLAKPKQLVTAVLWRWHGMHRRGTNRQSWSTSQPIFLDLTSPLASARVLLCWKMFTIRTSATWTCSSRHLTSLHFFTAPPACGSTSSL